MNSCEWDTTGDALSGKEVGHADERLAEEVCRSHGKLATCTVYNVCRALRVL